MPALCPLPALRIGAQERRVRKRQKTTGRPLWTQPACAARPSPHRVVRLRLRHMHRGGERWREVGRVCVCACVRVCACVCVCASSGKNPLTVCAAFCAFLFLPPKPREAKRVAVWGHVDWKAQRGDVQPPAGCVATPHIMKHVDPFCCSRVVTSPSSRHTAVIQQLVSLAFPLFFPLSLINPGLLWFLMQCLSATAFPAP